MADEVVVPDPALVWVRVRSKAGEYDVHQSALDGLAGGVEVIEGYPRGWSCRPDKPFTDKSGAPRPRKAAAAAEQE